MAKYILYHPSDTDKSYIEHFSQNTNAYCTDVMMHSISEALRDQNHSVEIQYVQLSYPVEGVFSANLTIPELEIDISEVPSTLWFIIANADTKKFVIVDLQDSPVITYRLDTHKNFVFSLVGQFSLERYKIESGGCIDRTKLVPYVYTAYYPLLTESLREEIQDIRRSTEKLDDRIFFYGNNRDTYIHSDGDSNTQKIREVISVLEEKYPNESCVGSWETKLPLEEFFKKAATHTINLGLPGHQWCSREHELWTLGLPVMLYEHTHRMAVDLIPNYHYIAVAAGRRLTIGMAKDPELAADEIVKVHREWIKPENRWRVNFVANNGKERMDNYASPKIIGKITLPLLALGHW